MSLLVPSTETSCLVVGSMMAILFLSRVRVEVLWGAAAACGGGRELVRRSLYYNPVGSLSTTLFGVILTHLIFQLLVLKILLF